MKSSVGFANDGLLYSTGITVASISSLYLSKQKMPQKSNARYPTLDSRLSQSRTKLEAPRSQLKSTLLTRTKQKSHLMTQTQKFLSSKQNMRTYSLHATKYCPVMWNKQKPR
jgi:hypothetical protein